MQTSDNPSPSKWPGLCVRPSIQRQQVEAVVEQVFEQVAQGGDGAVKMLVNQFDRIQIDDLMVPIGSIQKERRQLSAQVADAVDNAYAAIRDFHERQKQTKPSLAAGSWKSDVVCWRESRPIEKVGLYVPGGSAPLVSTMLMLGVPAQIAGCSAVSVCTPLAPDGSVYSAIRYAAAKCGIRSIYRISGAQAIAAMSLGTETVARVDKLFGPGNQYVTAAKERAQRYGVAIDMPAGPSEVMVIADGTARPDYVAADLLSQAEHGPDSQVMLVTTSRTLQRAVADELQLQLRSLARKDIARQALRTSGSIYFTSIKTCVSFANMYAPEHLILQINNPRLAIAQVQCAGSVFLGAYSPESAGDYTSGPNHTLPTNGWARSYSGLSVADFQKQISFQRLSKRGLEALAPTIVTLANTEGLTAHARAVSIRLQSSIMETI